MKRHVVIALHGIWTGSENWTDRFRRWAERNETRIAVEEYSIGKIIGLQMYTYGIFSPFGWHLQKKFADWVAEMLQGHDTNSPYSIVAHSFGTWLTHGTLWRYPLLTPRCVVLFGSVLTSHYKKTKFSQMFGRKQIKKLINVWSPHDTTIEHLSQPILGLSPFGHLGSRGFKKTDWGIDRVDQVKTLESHGSYWSPENQEIYFKHIAEECLTV